MSELQKLLERVEKATGPDQEINDALMALNHFRDERFIGAYYEDGEQAVNEVWVDRETNEWRSTHAHDYTASIDAALALVGRVLPGWEYRLDQYGDHNDCNLTLWDAGARIYVDDVDGTGATMPLAILAALLKALIAQEQQK